MTSAARPLKLLFIHPFGIGDVIFSLTAAEALAKRGHSVDYLCNERTGELLDLCPVVRRTLPFDRSAIRADWSARRYLKVWHRYLVLKNSIRQECYDAVLDFSMGREYAVLAWAAGIKTRIGWDYKNRGRFLTQRVRITGFDDRSPRDAALDLACLADPGLAALAAPPAYPALNIPHDADIAGWLTRITGGQPYFVLAPGGGESWGKDAHYKRWPAEHWTALAGLLREDTRARIIVLGSASEAELVTAITSASSASKVSSNEINEISKNIIPVTGEPLRKVAALIAGARAFVGNDGGLLHLANALKVPLVGLYGPVSETGYGPLLTASPAQVLTVDVACRPCYKSFRFNGCAYNQRCLTEITPQRAAEEVRTLLIAKS
jgi:heptosyltransferase-2